MSGQDVTQWFVEALMASAILLALVMLLRRPVARYFGVRAAYALWALPLLRLILPRLPEEASPSAYLPVHHAPVPISYVREAVQVPVAQFPWIESALMLWMAGAVVFLAVQAIGYYRFRRLMLSDGTFVRRDGKVTTLESVHASGPLAFGIVHKHIVVPIDFADRYSAQEQAMALAHEHMHHQRGDLLANLIAALLLALQWCNPIAWIAYRAFRVDQELACDAQVLARHGAIHAQDYGRAILKAATATPLNGGNRFSICHLNTVDTLKGRLKMLSTHTDSLRRITWGMTAVAAVTVSGLALTASGSQVAKEMASVSTRLSSVKLTKLATFMPQVATVPETPEPPYRPEMTEPYPAPETPVAPEAPLAPAAMAAPTPPTPPTPPAVPSGARQVKSASADGATSYRAIAYPSKAEIATMVPNVRVERRCNGEEDVSTQSYTDAWGNRQVRVRICQEAIQRQAMAEAQAGREEARAGIAEAKVQLAEAERAVASAQYMSAHARAQAKAELGRARAEIRREIAEMERERVEGARERARSRRETD
ncbi:MAG: M56 family metallopeptidase [Pseudomonadota bacterium]|jgi:bla regulator protein BlaR1